MKLKEILKNQGLTDEQISSVVKEMKDNKVYTTSLENADERYSKLKGQKADVDELLKTANLTIDDLKKNNKDNTKLQKTIKEHETTIETLKKEAEKKDFNYALDSALKDNKCKNAKALKALLDLDNIKFNEGELEGLDSQIEKLKESDSYLFDDDTPGNTGTPGGKKRTHSQNANPFAEATFNLTEQGKLFKDNPEKARELASLAGIEINF